MNNEKNKIRTVIADDEPAARESINILLSSQHDIHVVAACKDGKETAETILALRPDLVFLDIQMPEMNGFEVLETIRPDFIPAFVFVTAFDQYAIKAFDQSAIDYLLKPYDDERFYQSLEKSKQWVAVRNMNQQMLRIEGLLSSMKKETPLVYQKKLTIKNNGQITFIPTDTIFSIESEGNFVKVHTPTGTKIASYTFKQLEEMLDPKTFVRIHKSHIVNLDRIEMIEPHFHGDYNVLLKNGLKLKLSRNYKESLDRILNQF